MMCLSVHLPEKLKMLAELQVLLSDLNSPLYEFSQKRQDYYVYTDIDLKYRTEM